MAHQWRTARMQGMAHDMRMNVRVDTAVHGQQRNIPVISIAQDPAEAETMLVEKQTSAGGGSSNSTVRTVLRLQTGTLARELPAQTQYTRLAKKGQLHGTVNGEPYKQTVPVARLTPKALVADGEVHVLLPPCTPAQRQRISAAAAAGSLQLSITLVEAGMEADQTTTFQQPAQQTPAVARIKLDPLSVSNPTVAAAALPAGRAASGAAPTPAAAAFPQPGLTPGLDAAGASVIARLVSIEQQLSSIVSRVDGLHISVGTLSSSSQSHGTQLARQGMMISTMESTVHEHQSQFQHVLQVLLSCANLCDDMQCCCRGGEILDCYCTLLMEMHC